MSIYHTRYEMVYLLTVHSETRYQSFRLWSS